MPDWSAIRIDYEQGLSLRALAVKHGISKTVIGERKYNEQWTQERTADGQRTADRIPHAPKPFPLPMPGDAISIARIGLSQLAQHLQGDTILEVKDHKMLSDALAQYLKVLTTAPQEPEVKEGLTIPLEKLSPHTRMEIRRLLAEDAQERTG